MAEFRCDICGAVLASRNGLSGHRQLKHGGQAAVGGSAETSLAEKFNGIKQSYDQLLAKVDGLTQALANVGKFQEFGGKNMDQVITVKDLEIQDLKQELASKVATQSKLAVAERQCSALEAEVERLRNKALAYDELVNLAEHVKTCDGLPCSILEVAREIVQSVYELDEPKKIVIKGASPAGSKVKMHIYWDKVEKRFKPAMELITPER